MAGLHAAPFSALRALTRSWAVKMTWMEGVRAMSSVRKGGGVADGATVGRFRPPEWHEVERAILAGRRLRAEWVRQQAARLIGRLRERWLGPAGQTLRRRGELKALLALDDRMLADIGVRRAEVQGVLYGVLSWKDLVCQRDERRLLPANVVRLERSQPPALTPDLGKAA
jgi:uncharacterized protein YjiS (DUF1127 family)